MLGMVDHFDFFLVGWHNIKQMVKKGESYGIHF